MFTQRLDQLRRTDWVVYAEPPFGGPEQVLAYLGRYTHRVAIANSRLISLADGSELFLEDYRRKRKAKVMTLDAGEFMRRFRLQTLPDGFHHIRLMASSPMADATIKSPSAVSSLTSATLRLIKKPAMILSSNARSPSAHIAAPPCGASTSSREPARATNRFVVTRHDQRLHHPPVP